jgi:thioredoxin reductase (NADPH)
LNAAIIGAGPIGLELAVALKQQGIDYVHLDAGQIGATMQWYPLEMLFHSSAERLAIAGVPIQVPDQQKPKREEYLAYLRAVVQQFALEVRTFERVELARVMPGGGFELHTRAVDGQHLYRVGAVVLAIGSMHAPRLMGVPGEELPHVSHYFHDPHTYFAKELLIIGGRNSAVEAAVRCQRAGAHVTLSYRGPDIDPSVKFWLLPELRSMIRDNRVRFLPGTRPVEIRRGSIVLERVEQASGLPPGGGEAQTGRLLHTVRADFVLALTGYRQDSTLFEMLGVDMQGAERRPRYDEVTMETNVPGVFIAGTAISGSPEERVRAIVEDCHVHVPRIVAALARVRTA